MKYVNYYLQLLKMIVLNTTGGNTCNVSEPYLRHWEHLKNAHLVLFVRTAGLHLWKWNISYNVGLKHQLFVFGGSLRVTPSSAQRPLLVCAKRSLSWWRSGSCDAGIQMWAPTGKVCAQSTGQTCAYLYIKPSNTSFKHVIFCLKASLLSYCPRKNAINFSL